MYTCDICGAAYEAERQYQRHSDSCQLKWLKGQVEQLTTQLHEKAIECTRLTALLDERKVSFEHEQQRFDRITTILAEKPSSSSSVTTTHNDLRVFHMNSNTLETKMNATLNREHIYGGQSEFAKYAVEHLLKDEDGHILYKCTDPSRKVFVYLNEKGEPVRDIKATKLIESVAGPLKRIGTAFIEADSQVDSTLVFLCKENVDECSNLESNSGLFVTKLSQLTS